MGNYKRNILGKEIDYELVDVPLNQNKVAEKISSHTKAEFDRYLKGIELVPQEFRKFYLDLVEIYSVIGLLQISFLDYEDLDTEKILLGNLKKSIIRLLNGFLQRQGSELRIFERNLIGENSSLLFYLNKFKNELYESTSNGSELDSSVIIAHMSIVSVYERKLDRLFNMN